MMMNNIGKKMSIYVGIVLFIVWSLVLGPDYEVIIVAISYFFLAYFLGSFYDKLKCQSEHDELTGALNRRYVTHTLAKKKSSSLSVCLIDVNDFKIINDTYGHHIGDIVLKRIVEILKNNMRTTDKVVRWGGDEFLLILPNTSNPDICSLVTRVNKNLEELSLEMQFRISVSIGDVSGEECLESLINKADEKMYKIKRKMKKQVSLDSIL